MDILKSLRQNKIGILLMLISSIFVCTGQLFWKLFDSKSFHFLLIGFCLYGLGAVVMIVAYKFGSLSVLQPVLSMNYIFTIFLASFVLGEIITPLKLIGILIITFSVILIGGGDN